MQTDFATVFRRDLQANVFLTDDTRWGYAEFRLTFDGDAITGGGVAVVAANIVTLFVPALVGAPWSLRKRTLQAEVALFDSRRVEIAQYTITGKGAYGIGLYTQDEYRRAGIDAAKDIMSQFRQLLAPEVDVLNQRLRGAGPAN